MNVKYQSWSCQASQLQKLQNNTSTNYQTANFALCINIFLTMWNPTFRIHVFRARRLLIHMLSLSWLQNLKLWGVKRGWRGLAFTFVSHFTLCYFLQLNSTNYLIFESIHCCFSSGSAAKAKDGGSRGTFSISRSILYVCIHISCSCWRRWIYQ